MCYSLWKHIQSESAISLHPLRLYTSTHVQPRDNIVFPCSPRVPHAGNHDNFSISLFLFRVTVKAAENLAITGFDQNAVQDIRVESCGLSCAGNTVSCLAEQPPYRSGFSRWNRLLCRIKFIALANNGTNYSSYSEVCDLLLILCPCHLIGII